jgi:hypothetical protein
MGWQEKEAQMDYIVRGRCIEGTCYPGYRHMAFQRSDAQRMTLRQAQDVVASYREYNARVSPDYMVGRLEILPWDRRTRAHRELLDHRELVARMARTEVKA